MSADDRPVAGAVPGWDNAWVATGHGTSGLLLGPYTSALLAEQILGRPPAAAPDFWPALSPARFGPTSAH
jgi:D-amino-acid dehydrogenase